jgi:hypothetical protein
MTFKEGDRADVAANVTHEAWIGPQVRISNYLEYILHTGQGCTYVIGK